jgi:hypothetical protein
VRAYRTEADSLVLMGADGKSFARLVKTK